MKRTSVILLPLLLSAIAAQAQLVPCSFGLDEQKRSSEFFQWNKKFEHSVALPDRLAGLLQSDEANQKKFHSCKSRGDVQDIPRTWFAAAQVNLVKGESPALLVKATHSCLLDQEQERAPFWLFRETESDYSLLLTVETGGLQVFQDSHNGYHDLCTIFGNYGTYWENSYHYDGGKYEVFQDSLINVDFFPPPVHR